MLQKSTLNIADSPDMIFLYRRPILDYWCETGEDIAQVVRNVLIHEIGHHFGFSDDDMDRIEHEI
jgi:predicted Zn-dependent protease with MMP-like domain